jgi:hypothetical protein
MKQIDKTKLFYIDKAGIKQYIYRTYAKSLKEQKIYAEIIGKRYIRTNIISALNRKNKLVSPLLFDGITDTNLALW